MSNKINAVIPGRFTKMVHKKEYKERNGARVMKIVRSVVRFGCSAQNLSNYEHKGNGLPEGSKWIAYPFLIENKNAQLKVRVYPTHNSHQKAKTLWLVTINGKTRETTKEEALANGWVVPSEVKSSPEDLPMFDVMLDNIIQIG